MSKERRSETRIKEATTIFVEVCSSSFDNSSPANIILCNSIDISANGILVHMDENVEVGTILRLCADFGEDRKPIYLVGEAKWVAPETQGFNVGFEIYDAEDTDILNWKTTIADMLN